MSKVLYRLNFSAIVTSAFYLILFFNLKEALKFLFFGLYHANILFLLIYFFDFIFVFIEIPIHNISFKILRKIYKFLAVLNTISFVVNVFTRHAFEITVYDGAFFKWIPSYRIGFFLHLLACYCFVLIIIFSVCKKIYYSNKFYRKKYFIVLVEFCLIVLMNAFFVFSKSKMDISILLFMGFSSTVLYYLFYLVPKDIETKMLLLISENLDSAVFCFDVTQRIIFLNREARKIFPANREIFTELSSLLAEKKWLIFRNINMTIEGKNRIFEEEFHVIADQNERIVGYYFHLNDITKEINLLSEENYRLTYDMLTGFYNRRNFFIEVEKALREDPKTPRYLVCTNIRDFKLINDLYGSVFGDELLKEQAKQIAERKSLNPIFGRISGDKFAFLIRKEDFVTDDMAKSIAKLQEFMRPFNFKLHICLGVYEISDAYENVYSMFDKANLAVKSNAKNYSQIVSFYTTSMMEELFEEKRIVSMFEKSFEDNDFVMYLQPQISSKDGKVAGAEALVRWINMEKGILCPADFIPILEKANYLYRLDKYIWELAAKKLAEWKERGIDMYIAVNISAKDFYHLDLYKFFTELVEKYEISPSKLKLEITETVVMSDINFHISTIKKLREYGFCIELDDFGSGYSSLNILKNIEVDVLKIDMFFLRFTEENARRKKILELIVEMAKKLGMDIVIEGIEDEDSAEFLKSLGCDIFQGYLYSKPIPVHEFEEKFIENNRSQNG